MVILSWGRPGQDGEGHVNGQSPEAIEGKMRGRGWERDEARSLRLREAAHARWLRNNVQVFNKASPR